MEGESLLVLDYQIVVVCFGFFVFGGCDFDVGLYGWQVFEIFQVLFDIVQVEDVVWVDGQGIEGGFVCIGVGCKVDVVYVFWYYVQYQLFC